MKTRQRCGLAFGVLMGLGACSGPDGFLSGLRAGGESAVAPVEVATDVEESADVLRPQARPEGLTAAPAPVAAPVASGPLGSTVASLGNPAEPGLWLKTPLVRAEQAGRVSLASTGQSVAVTLIPLEGPPTGGSQLSLSAMQALGAGLADLPTIEVFAGA